MHFHVKAATGKQNGGQNNDKSASIVLVHLKNIESPVFGVKTCLNVKEIEKFENYIYTIGSIKETAVYSN